VLSGSQLLLRLEFSSKLFDSCEIRYIPILWAKKYATIYIMKRFSSLCFNFFITGILFEKQNYKI